MNPLPTAPTVVPTSPAPVLVAVDELPQHTRLPVSCLIAWANGPALPAP